MSTVFGVRDVMELTFFNMETKAPELVLNYCKVTNLETTTETAEARGGMGNDVIMSWDYGRTATFNITHATLSDEMLRAITGDKGLDGVEAQTKYIERIKATNDSVLNLKHRVVTVESGEGLEPIPLKVYDDKNKELSVTLEGDKTVSGSFEIGKTYKVIYVTTTDKAKKFTFSADKYPGYYTAVGRYYSLGDDGIEYENLVVMPKVRVNSDFAIELDAEGDPATFEMTLSVEKDANEDMVKIIRI